MTHIKRGFPASVPHLCSPFRFELRSDGTVSAETVEQDSVEEITNCVEAILRYEQGQRPEQPGFGIVSPLFQSGTIRTEPIREAVQEWEPRADIDIKSEISTKDELLQHLTVEVADETSGGVNA